MIANNYKLISFLVASAFCFFNQNASAQAYAWANSAGGSTGQDYGFSTATDANGNVVVGGAFRGTVDFDPSAIAVFNLANSTTVDNGSVTKYDANGAFAWAFKIGGTGGADAAQVYAVATDAAGNVYITGRFRGVADFNPDGVVTNNLTALGANYDMFVAKYDATGAYLWAFNMGGASDDSSQGIAVDNNGNVYLVGMFQGNMDFDPSGGIASITTTGGYDISISKYTTAGAYQWAYKVGGTGSDRGFGIILDNANNVIITGRSTSTNLDADPAAGVATFATNGAEDAFVAKYDNNGAYQWAALMGSTGVDEGLNVATDAANNVYAVGRFAISLDADPSGAIVALTSAGALDGYLIKYNSTGQYQAGFRLGAANGDEIQSVFADANNVYITGAFNGTVDFDPSVANIANLNPANTSNDVFVASYDLGLNYVSAFNVGGANNDIGYDIFVQNANMHVCGGFQATADFNPSASVVANLPSNGLNDMFIAKYTPCVQPTSPTAAVSTALICGSGSATLSVTAGSLGSASNWSWYENTCSGASVGAGTTLTVNPTVSTTYYVRAEGGCVNPSACAMTMISVSSRPSVTATATNVSCNGQNDGFINLNVSNGSSPYTFAWSNSQTTQNITGLSPNNYEVTVSDAVGCTTMTMTTISEPAAFMLTLSLTSVDCAGDSTGVATASAAGAVMPYTYLWNNGATINNLNNIPAGVYSITVTDANACDISSSGQVLSPSVLSVMSNSSNNPTSCGTATGAINVMGMGGVSPYSFNINGNTFTANNNFSNLTAGIYTIGILDDNGCFETGSVTLSDPSGISVSVSGTNVSCFAGDNGSAMATSAGATGAVTYVWSDGQMTAMASGLVADMYSVTATDANNCSAFAAVTVTEPNQLFVSTLTMPASTATTADGTATANVSGGSAPYQFIWSGGQSSSNATGLLTGTYTVTITDANGCDITAQVAVSFNVNVNQNVQNPIIAFPNPTQNLLNLQNLPSNGSLRIINSLGQIVWQNIITAPSMDISLQNLNPALYYLQIIENQHITTISIRKE